jgi:hypothetical protein
MPATLEPGVEFGPCPACDSRDARTLFETTDRLYRTTRQVFRVVECRQCRLLRLDPWPAPAEMSRYYPDGYWFPGDEDAASRMAESYRRLVLRDHVGSSGGPLHRARKQVAGRRMRRRVVSPYDADAAIAWRLDFPATRRSPGAACRSARVGPRAAGRPLLRRGMFRPRAFVRASA